MAAKILLSIKPEFAKEIFFGEKRIEFRRKLPQDINTGDTIAVYATHPERFVIGEFCVYGTISCGKNELWHQTCDRGGVSREYFDAYFESRDVAHAIIICAVMPFIKPIPLEKYAPHLKRPPQSFCYLPFRR